MPVFWRYSWSCVSLADDFFDFAKVYLLEGLLQLQQFISRISVARRQGVLRAFATSPRVACPEVQRLLVGFNWQLGKEDACLIGRSMQLTSVLGHQLLILFVSANDLLFLFSEPSNQLPVVTFESLEILPQMLILFCDDGLLLAACFLEQYQRIGRLQPATSVLLHVIRRFALHVEHRLSARWVQVAVFAGVATSLHLFQ